VNDLKEFNKIMETSQKFPKSFKLFIYCDKTTIKQISKIIKPNVKKRNDEAQGYQSERIETKFIKDGEDECTYMFDFDKEEESEEEDCKFFIISKTNKLIKLETHKTWNVESF
jgi:hypothetical protein